jgi:hypothetical protein
MATETYRYFDLPRGGGRFQLLADWWVEAGMDDFRRETEAYLLTVYPAVQLIALTDIEPPPLGGRAHLTDSGFDFDRMMRILQGIASKQVIPPVEVKVKDHQQGGYRYEVHNGWHRFYASVAAGFPCLPTVTVSGWKPDTPAINEPRF